MGHYLSFVTAMFPVSEASIVFFSLNPDESRFDLIDILSDIQAILVLFLLRNRQVPEER
jgi:hypothetical protein